MRGIEVISKEVSMKGIEVDKRLYEWQRVGKTYLFKSSKCLPHH